MAHGLNSVIKRTVTSVNCKNEGAKGIGSRRIFAPHFKLQVLDSYRNDADCKGNQRATARKYGIHRRQIQKWLQVENTLRNAVSNKEKPSITDNTCEALNGNRQHDDDRLFVASATSASEPRVPALPQQCPLSAPYVAPLPLDFTTHSRGHITRSEPASPVVARPDSPLAALDPAAPIDLSFKRPTSTQASAPVRYTPLSPPLPASLPRPHPDVWDLSTKNLKRKCEDSSPKPVKLFKPYLDDIKDEEEPISTKSEPCCHLAMSSTCETYYYNNNNVCDIKSEYSTYTLHELQPNATVSYCYYPQYSGDYEIGGCCYEDISYAQNLAPLKQRQSYSLDFKLSAIDCYYQDSICKGNQRAVANKYNVHRRQVQKWLKQAEELRLRNETVKQMHAVR